MSTQTMEYRKLGKSGVKVSALSYGAWVTFGNQVTSTAKDIMTTAREGGINFWDNAEVYANGKAEEVMGQAFKELGWKRSDHVFSTKIFWGGSGPNDQGLSRKHIIEGTQASLKRYQLDYVDLIFCHRPDPNVQIEETVRAMNYVIDHGWAFYWGTSEWSAAQITEAKDIAKRLGLMPPQFEQPEYNLFARHKVEVEFKDLYESDSGLGLTTWSPLASGVLTGKYSGGQVPEGSRFGVEQYKSLAETKLVQKRHEIDQADQLKPIAKELGYTPAQVALAWCVSNPHVSSVITGATKIDQIKENLKAMEVVPKLTPELQKRINEIFPPPKANAEA